ncbi:unnamed protein product [Hydatigera taeniaeformis]|uniref:RRM domain-containing protein n=1 Tax=Hydatigena taeniaeformis TaxID=6205 RepID=A0A0R3WHK6_HYDTA|nr:unnamed protein product [Hydatigera taeniaeformis]
MSSTCSSRVSVRKNSGVRLRKSDIYSALKISHLPKHFEEKQLREYFAQFGTVYGVHLPRSRKTLNAKDQAFILVDKEIASIIASTVHNVLNFNKIMKCQILDTYYPRWFRRTPPPVSTVELEKRRRLKSTVKQTRDASKRRMKNLRNRVAALKKLAPAFQLNVFNGAPTPAPSSN